MSGGEEKHVTGAMDKHFNFTKYWTLHLLGAATPAANVPGVVVTVKRNRCSPSHPPVQFNVPRKKVEAPEFPLNLHPEFLLQFGR